MKPNPTIPLLRPLQDFLRLQSDFESPGKKDLLDPWQQPVQ